MATKKAKVIEAPAVKVVEEVKEKRFSSYKATLRFNDGKGLSFTIPIRWKKLDTKQIDAEYPIVFRTKQGQEAKFKSMTSEGNILATQEDMENGWLKAKNFTQQKKAWITEDGAVILDGVQSFQVVDGKEELVEKMKKTEDFIVLSTKPAAEYNDWLQENIYAIWCEKPIDTYSLSKFGKFLFDNSKMAIIKLSTGNSFKEFHGLIVPRFYDKKTGETLEAPKEGCGMGITLKTTRIKIKFEDFGQMDYTTVQPAPEKEVSPTKAKGKMDTI